MFRRVLFLLVFFQAVSWPVCAQPAMQRGGTDWNRHRNVYMLGTLLNPVLSGQSVFAAASPVTSGYSKWFAAIRDHSFSHRPKPIGYGFFFETGTDPTHAELDNSDLNVHPLRMMVSKKNAAALRMRNLRMAAPFVSRTLIHHTDLSYNAALHRNRYRAHPGYIWYRVPEAMPLHEIARMHATTSHQLKQLNSLTHTGLIAAGRELCIPAFYNPNEMDPRTGIKQELMQYVDFSGSRIDVGFSPDETNSFPYDVVHSDAQFGSCTGFPTILNRLHHFLCGTGATNMVFGPSTQFTKSVQNSLLTEQARSFFYRKYQRIYALSCELDWSGTRNKRRNLQKAEAYFTSLANRGEVAATEFRGCWTVADFFATGFGSNRRVGNQYIGSCSINIFASHDANRLLFVVANSTSNWSWKLHLGANISRTQAFGGAPNSTILNIMVWDEPIDYSRLHAF